MTEQRDHIEEALRVNAEAGVPEAAVPWPAIKERLGEKRLGGRPGERPGERETPGGTPRSHRGSRLVPRTRTGMALAAALVVLLGMGAYVASGPVYEQFRGQLPGAKGPNYGEQLGLVQTAHGVRVSVEWAYADQRNVVVGYNIEDLEGNRRVASRPAEVQGQDKLTDESSVRFHPNGGQASTSGNRKPLTEVPSVGVYAPDKAIEPGNHEFRLDIPVVAQALPSTGPYKTEPVGEPFVFDFEIPVRPAPAIEVNQTVEAAGVALTLKRVVNSPARPEAKICSDSPDTRYDWNIWGDFLGAGPGAIGGGPIIGQDRACTTILLPARLEGRSSVTVKRLVGSPDCPPGDDNGCSIPQSRVKTIDGPWTFDVTAPKR